MDVTGALMRENANEEPRSMELALAVAMPWLAACNLVDDEPASVEDPGSDAYSEDRRPGGRLRLLRARREERRALRRLDAGVSR